ncbi:MAG: hypothetical protein ACXWP5_08865 [Bdellovibrionota bacterium]
MTSLPRGIAPELLLSQIKNTMPYLFEPEAGETPLGRTAPAKVAREFEKSPTQPLSHFEYFRLCLSAHFLTCATPVPTDVDNQIRLKLWPAELPLETALQMAELVLETRAVDFTALTARSTHGLSGHQGEWFTVSAAAYCALKRDSDPQAKAKSQELFGAIADEVKHHSEVFGSLWRAGEGLSCLKASASIAHNFGDLDRVMDMWEVSADDPLRREFYKLGVVPFDQAGKLRYLGRLWTAGELYKSPIDGSAMALENHRHFALRKPRALRSSAALLIPTGPFFDDWGAQVSRRLDPEQVLEVVDALKQGWLRLPATVGYGRALRGMGQEKLASELSKIRGARGALETAQDRFEKKWADAALKWMDEIPSRAT